MSKASAEELYRLYNEENLSQREIGEKFGVGQAAVSNWMSELGVETDRAGKWSEKEKEILKKNYPDEKEKLKEELENRTWNAIKLKAMDLGLARDQEDYRYSEEVKEKLRGLAEESQVHADMDKKAEVSYVLGVLDGDGFTDNRSTLGLETASQDFAEKFVSYLDKIGLNPNIGDRRDKKAVWASSMEFQEWFSAMDYEEKFEWLKMEGDFWKYLEGAYDSDGNLSNPGPRICSYDSEEKKFLKRILDYLGLEASIQQNNVYVKVDGKEKFFRNVNPVYEKRAPTN